MKRKTAKGNKPEYILAMHIDERRILARRIFDAAVASVQPELLILNKVRLVDNTLEFPETQHTLRPDQQIHVFGSGKASVGMAKSLLSVMKGRVAGGTIVTSQLTADDLSPLIAVQGSHPVPDEKSISGAELLLAGLSQLTSADFFIYVLSGGSSALIEKPVHPITLAEIQETTRLLLENSVPIQHVNAVRKHLSMVKGGRLAQSTEASGIVLVLSDVINDDLSVIGSAPLYYDKTSFRQCKRILEHAAIWNKIPATVREVITMGEKGEIPETPKEPIQRISHCLLGTNRLALEQAKAEAELHGMPCHIMSSSLAGEASEVAKVLVSIAQNIDIRHEPFKPPVCLLFGGETTVTLRGSGKGGRNQELALSALAEIGQQDNILLLSGGTDGIDGNSSATGAIADSGYFMKGSLQGLSIERFLEDNDSNTFFSAVGGLLETGPTGTNVMDISLLIIDKEDL